MTLLLPLVLLVGAASPSAPAPEFKVLKKGIEYAALPFGAADDPDGGRLHVVRIEPAQVTWQLGLASKGGGPSTAEAWAESHGLGGPRTAQAWADGHGFPGAINAGMYQEDHRRNVGHLHDGEHVNNAAWKSAYASAFAFGPKKKGLPAATLVDLDAPGAREQLADYRTVVQNLRLIKAAGPGTGASVWKPNGRRWSEAAVALDAQGRVLFLFSRAPFEMDDFAKKLLALPLGVVRAMHVEGGPEASLSLRAAGEKSDRCGSYETGFYLRDDNDKQWPIPNVIGVK